MPDETNNAPEQQNAPSGTKPTFDTKDVEENKVMGALAYLIFFLPLITSAKNSKFAKEHAKQSLILLLVSIVGSTVLTIIPILGWLILPFFTLAIFVFYIIAFVKAIQGEFWEVPLIGQWRSWFKF